jgi:uncharacterized membrane protein YuzA (DUF378 family)
VIICINQVIFVIKCGVLFEVGTTFLHVIYINVGFSGLPTIMFEPAYKAAILEEAYIF